MKQKYPKVNFISIQLNNGYTSAMHVDGISVGPSVIIALGDFTGGQLWAYDPSGSTYRPVTRRLRGFPEVRVGEKLPGNLVSIHNRPFEFDGTLPHGTEKFTGERFSLVFFVHRLWNRAKSEVIREARELGFPARSFELESARLSTMGLFC